MGETHPAQLGPEWEHVREVMPRATLSPVEGGVDTR